MEDVSLACVSASPALALYRIQPSPIEAFIASTPETRSICNDPTVAGVRYTDLLRKACTEVLRALPNDLQEAETVVVNILRGGLNFGLRDALAAAYNWNAHTTSFISAQRARDERDTDAWHITENAYRKVYLPPRASFVIGDVVATGTSLRYGLQELVLAAREQKIDVRSILFFTYGGPQSENILSEIDARCRELFPGYEKTTLIYLEGRFAVAASDTTAYFVGTRFGHHKLWPRVSPNKSSEGAVGSLIGCVIFCTIYGACLGKVNFLAFIPLAILINAFAQLGDLFESALKRSAKIKDSGHLLPGHGGILDRADSLLFAMPVFAVVDQWFFFF